jgi:hypothetical protein
MVRAGQSSEKAALIYQHSDHDEAVGGPWLVIKHRNLIAFVWPPVWLPEHDRGPIAIKRSAL